MPKATPSPYDLLMAIHFLSDLHLSADTPALNALFITTLARWQHTLEALYILGDLFEYWIGDDDDDNILIPLLAAMRDFAAHTPLFVMHGNRDFLMGKGFEQRSGARLIADPALIEVGTTRLLLCHGDTLCTEDTPYQQFRAISRQPAWQRDILARSLAERRTLARQIRGISEQNKKGLTSTSDATPQAINALLQQYNWPTLIHGHTHRPAQHQHSDGLHQTTRWVIADWHDDHGGYLRLDAQGIHAHRLTR